MIKHPFFLRFHRNYAVPAFRRPPPAQAPRPPIFVPLRFSKTEGQLLPIAKSQEEFHF